MAMFEQSCLCFCAYKQWMCRDFVWCTLYIVVLVWFRLSFMVQVAGLPASSISGRASGLAVYTLRQLLS